MATIIIPEEYRTSVLRVTTDYLVGLIVNSKPHEIEGWVLYFLERFDEAYQRKKHYGTTSDQILTKLHDALVIRLKEGSW